MKILWNYFLPLKNSIVLFFFSVFKIDPRDSPLLLWLNSFFLIPVRTSIIYRSEITDFPKKLTVKNVMKNECFFKKHSVMETRILISTPSNLYLSPNKPLNLYNILWKTMCHWNFLPDLLESLYSFEISQKLTTIKTEKNAVKSGCF